MLFQESITVGESRSAFSWWQQAKEKSRTLPQPCQRLNHSRRNSFLLLQRGLNVARQFFKTQIADAHAKITSCHVFQFVRFVENHGGKIRQNARIGAAGLSQRQVGKEKMVVHDDDVTLRGAAMHLRDEATVPLLAFLPGTAFAARVKLLPQLRALGKALQLGAIAALGRLFPLSDLAVLLNLLKSAQDWLVRQIVKFLPAKVIITAFHIANAQFAQVLLQEWDILKEELFLQVLGAGGNNHAFAAADHRQKIRQSLARSRAGLDNQVPSLNQSFFHRFRHLQLPTTELVIRMCLTE